MKQFRNSWVRPIYSITVGLLITILVMFAVTAEAGLLDKLKELLKSSEQQSTDQSEGRVGGAKSDAPLTEKEVGDGLKDALVVGVEAVVNQLGAVDGFNKDPTIHVPLPGSLDKARSALEKIGMSSTFEDLELALNRAAEVAVPKSRELLLTAIRDMTLEDVMDIYRGPDDAATQYFRTRMAGPLSAEMRPVVDESLGEVGAADLYSKVADSYNSLPFVSPVDSDLTPYVLEKGLDGIFHYLAQEEAAIRKNPVKRTTELLKKVFKGF
jgi:hypothetical protein